MTLSRANDSKVEDHPDRMVMHDSCPFEGLARDDHHFCVLNSHLDAENAVS